MAVDPVHFVDASKGIRRHFFTLVDSLSALSSLADLEIHHRPSRQLLTDALDVLAQIDGFEASAIFLAQGEALACAAVRRWEPASLRGIGPKLIDGHDLGELVARPDSPMAQAVASGEIQRVPDCTTLDASAPEASGFPLPAAGSLLCCPILSRGEALGAVVLHAAEPDYFELSHEPMLVLFCSVLGYVIDNHRLMQFMEDAVVERTAELSATNAQLEQEIGERKRAELRLERARDDALEAARVKGRFLANMSHELRTPLNGVLGTLQLLEDTAMDEGQTEYVGLALESGKVLSRFIDEILDFSEIDAGRVSIQQVELDPAATLGEAAAAFAGPARAKGLEYRYAVDADLPSVVLGDPARLVQVVSKLVGNAVKFTEQGWISVSIDGTWSRPDRYELRLEVADSGIGMSADEIDAAFQSFTQADGTASRKYGGGGLGLAIASELVTRMEGSISVESEPGQGSRFRVVLPCTVPAAPGPREAVPVLASGSATAVDCAHLRRLWNRFGDALEDVVDAYLEGAPAWIELLRSSIDAPEPAQARRTARSLQAASRNLGAVVLPEMCEQVLRQIQHGDMPRARDQLAQAEHEFHRIRNALVRFHPEAPAARAG